MGKLFAKLATVIGTLVALTASGACWVSWVDEVETPNSLIK